MLLDLIYYFFFSLMILSMLNINNFFDILSFTKNKSKNLQFFNSYRKRNKIRNYRIRISSV